ncbi:MAG: hypothetical protein PHY29_02985 [Syntrophales bacterium]|nr:hypothetical protein [Syntrophales bacterium]
MTMEPGQELDRLVAERVMEECYHVVADGQDIFECGFPVRCEKCGKEWDALPLTSNWPNPLYSTDLSAAWMVVEKMMSLGYRYVMRSNFEGNGLHWCGFDHQEWAYRNPLHQSELCKSLPHAICLAALATKEK